MGQILMMRVSLWVCFLAALGVSAAVVACGDDANVKDAATSVGDASADANLIDAESTSAMRSCLDRPGELPRPPTQGLPCDLLPPDWHL